MDAGVKKVVGLLENFYDNDEKTSFVLTSDHGMTNWGKFGHALYIINVFLSCFMSIFSLLQS